MQARFTSDLFASKPPATARSVVGGVPLLAETREVVDCKLQNANCKLQDGSADEIDVLREW